MIVDFGSFESIFKLAGLDFDVVFKDVDFDALREASVDKKIDLIRSYSSDFPFFYDFLQFSVYEDYLNARATGWAGTVGDRLRAVYYIEFSLRGLFSGIGEKEIIKKFRKPFNDAKNTDQALAELLTLSKLTSITDNIELDVPAQEGKNTPNFDFKAYIDGEYYNFEVTTRKDDFPPSIRKEVSDFIKREIVIPEDLLVTLNLRTEPDVNIKSQVARLVEQVDYIIQNRNSFNGSAVDFDGISFVRDKDGQGLYYRYGDTHIDSVYFIETPKYGGSLEIGFGFLSRATVEPGWENGKSDVDFDIPESKEVKDRLLRKLKQLPESGKNIFVFHHSTVDKYSIKRAMYGDEFYVLSGDLKRLEPRTHFNGLIAEIAFNKVQGIISVINTDIPIKGELLANPKAAKPLSLEECHLMNFVFS